MVHFVSGRQMALCAGTLLAIAPHRGALAQSADSAAARMNAIEAQIRSLQNELHNVRRDLAARDAQVRAARQDAAQARAAVRAEPAGRGTAPAGQGMASGPAGGGQGLTAGTQQEGSSGTSSSGGGGQTAGQQNASTTPGSTPNGSFRLGGITVTLGGFVEGAGIFRTRNEVTDVSSNFNTGIPLPNSALYHENEFRASARQSRISLLAEGNISPAQKLTAYFETDFQGGSPTANQNETNSYNLRLRQAYGTYDNTDLGLHVLAGQSWSLLTQQQVGITPRKEDIPLTIDAQYAVGFNWARQPQLRVVKDFADHKLWAGLSLEQPQNLVYVGPNGAGTSVGTASFQNPGAGILASTVNYSTDVAPDIIAKVAYDPGFAHLEAFGLARFLHDRVSVLGSGNSHTTLAGGGGVAGSVPFLDGKVSLRGSILGGYGIGRYGSGQLPDSTLSRSGAPAPVPSIAALVGMVGHPVPTVDLYGYVGTEQASRRSFVQAGKGYGYGSPLYSNAGCATELSTAGCTANTSGLVEGTLGAWWRFLRGPYGTAQVGAQYAYVRRDIFNGSVPAGGKGNNGTDNNIFLVSFRYLPFQ
jgi:outer membrane murein-binding lipoprotein Lpp